VTLHIPIKEAKNRLSELVRLFEAGERVVVTRNGEPVAELAKPRRGGLDLEALAAWKEERGFPEAIFGPVSSDFDDPLPEDFLSTAWNESLARQTGR
jgi:antitoxin (DNA-binding transcriptional repressor) of toxin-antitoxin stability system